MPDDKADADAQGSTAENETPSAKTTPFQETMAKMMARCGCRPERMAAMMAACCPPAQKEGDKPK